MQVDYTLHGKHYYAIGFENNAHSYELRNPFFKGSYPPKAITQISGGNPRCNVSEGFIDFLSAERLGYNDGNDSVVLNSVEIGWCGRDTAFESGRFVCFGVVG